MDTNKKEVYYDIVNGPNKDVLFDSCKYACVKGATIPINFDVASGYTVPKTCPGCAYVRMNLTEFKIMGIENEDGSGESFNIHGSVKKDGTPFHFKAYYSTKHRNGVIRFF